MVRNVTRKQILLALVSLAALVTTASVVSHYAGKPEVTVNLKETYPPVIFLGNQSAKERVTFYWGSNPSSADAFLKYVVPLYLNGKKSNSTAVFLVQYFANDKTSGTNSDFFDLRGPGALMFCAPTREAYAKLALEYLASASDKSRLQSVDSAKPYLINKALAELFEKTHISINDCVNSPGFDRRVRFALGFTEIERTKKGIGALPVFEYQHQVFPPSNSAQMRKLEALGLNK